MRFLCTSCWCALVLLFSLSTAFDSVESMIARTKKELTSGLEPSTSVNGTCTTKIHDFYVVVVQSLTRFKDYGNYSYGEMRQTDQRVASVISDFVGSTSFEVLQRTGQCNFYDSSRNFMDIVMEYRCPKGRNLGVLRWKVVFLSDCEQACQLIGQIGLNIVSDGLPVISHGCGSPEFNNPEQYRTFVRVSGQFTFLADPIVRLFVHFNVTRVVIVSSLDMAMEMTRVTFSEAFKKSEIQTYEFQLNTSAQYLSDDSLQTMFADAAEFIHANARYVVLLLRAPHIIYLLQAIKDNNPKVLGGGFILFTIEHRIVTVDQFRDMGADELASLQERLVTASRKPFPPEKPKESLMLQAQTTATDGDSDYGYVVDAQYVFYTALKDSQPQQLLTNADIIHRLRSGQMQVQGMTGQIQIDEQGTRRPDYVFLIIQDGRLMPLWTANSSSGITWINPEPVKWPMSSFPPDANPECAWDDKCASKQLFGFEPNTEAFRNSIILISCISVAILILICILLYRKISHVLAVRTAMESVIKWPDLTFIAIKEEDKEEEEDLDSLDLDSHKSIHPAANPQMLAAVYQHLDVAVKVLVGCPSVDFNDRNILEDIRQMRAIKHENIVEFIGVCIEAPNVAIVMFHTQRGSLQDVILSCDRRILSLDFLSSLLMDVCKGMEYLHTTHLGSHGHLSSTKCLVDMRWTCRVSGYGMGHFRKCESKVIKHDDDDEIYKDMMYIAPEILRMSARNRPLYGTKEGDVYSFAIILQEAVLVSQPYAIDLHQFSGEEIISQVRAKNAENPFRPSLGDDISKAWSQFIRDCWAEAPEARPTFREILLRLEKLSKDFNLGFIEKLMLKLEQHAINLQEMVKQATDNVVREKAKVDSLLYSLLPKIIADDLKQGKMTKPEKFNSATVYFADIVGFTKIAAISTPMQIVHVLNSLYREYDAITDRHDAYKVETIGDSYMVVSGLPIRNGQRHAVEIARLAVEAIDVLSNFKMEHLPGTAVMARIGIHSGNTLAGVVGLKMPRYCLFGETVVIAAKMESSGEANKIHISNSTAELLAGTKGFVLESRGEREIIKDVTIKTYFLRRNSKEEVFAWMTEKTLPTASGTVPRITSAATVLSPYMEKAEKQETSNSAEDPIKGHDGKITDNGIVYVFSSRDSK